MKQSGIDWIGNIPSHWDTTRIKHIFKESKERSIEGKELPLSLGKVCGLVPSSQKETKTLEAASFVNFKIVHPGEVVFNRFKARLFAVSKYDGIVTPEYAVYKDVGQHNLKYFVYLFGTEPYRAAFENKASGIGDGYSRLYTDDLFSMPTILPPLSEQSRIVAFLDEHCGKIDEAIAKHKALIEKLDEYRKAVITKAVTKGVRGERKMKGSGVKWLPDIPVDWDIERTKFHFSNHKIIVGDNASEYERLALTLNGVIKRDKEDTDGLQPKEFGGYQILRQGELVFKLIDLENVSTSRVGYSPYTGIVSPAYIILEKKKGIEPRYAEYYYLSLWLREIFNQLGDSGVRSSLNSKDLLELPIAIPSPKEQSEIVIFLDKKCATIDSAKEHHRQLITKLEEYKKSLIYNAVTGKIEC